VTESKSVDSLVDWDFLAGIFWDCWDGFMARLLVRRILRG
jgi:hypothetical protein